MTRFSPKEDEKLIRATRAGLSVKEVAAALGRPKSSILWRRKYLRERGILPPLQGRPVAVKLRLSEEVRDRLASLARGKGTYLSRYMAQVLSAHALGR